MKKQLTLPTFAGHAPAWLILALPVLLLLALRSCPRSQVLQGRDHSPRTLLPQKPKGGDSGAGDVTVLTLTQSPKYVRRMVRYLRSVRHLNPPQGYKGGRVFKNLEGRLPKGKRYYEYDLHPVKPGTSRGAERLVTDQEKAYFTTPVTTTIPSSKSNDMDKAAFMELLGAAYQFPDYYGRNLDAADEILSDMREDSSSDKLSLRPLLEALLAEVPAVERARIWNLLRDHFVVE